MEAVADTTSDDEKRETRDTFGELVDMTPSAPEKWLATDASRSAGQHKDGGGSTGHASGRAVVEILRKKKGDLTDSDYATCARSTGTSTATWRSARPGTCGTAGGGTR
ncbi:Protein of unknown function [Streptomyces sp. 2231.1]|nr:Protein of unknown function [Streptomyces sp. 2231.1]